MTENKAIIIGAGLTGLTTAYYLKKAGWQVQILERDQCAGGSICTHREDGFVFESGPNTGIASNEEVKELLQNLDKELEIEVLAECVRNRLVWHKYRWHNLPHFLGESLRTPLLKWTEKIRLLLGSIRNRHFATELLNSNNNIKPCQTVDPYIHGIYSGDFQGILSSKSENNSIPNNVITDPQHPVIRSSGESNLIFIKGGLDHLVKALVKNIGHSNFLFGIENLEIYPKGGLFSASYQHNGTTHKTEVHAVVSTVGAIGLGTIFPFLNNHEKELISKVPHIHVVQVVAGFKKWRGIPLKAFGGLVPPNENRNILGILFPSSFLTGRAPEHGALLSLFMGGIHHPETISLSDEVLLKMAMDELQCMLLIPDLQPDLFRIFRHPNAFPESTEHPEPRLQAMRDIETQFPGLILAGKMRDGVGMAHRIEQGTHIANNLIQKFLHAGN